MRDGEETRLDHRCLGGKWCSGRSGKTPAATAKPETLCPACIGSIQSDRDRLPKLKEAVEVFVGIKPVTAQVSKVAATKEPHSPLNLAAEALMGDIDDVLSRVGNYLVRDLVYHPAKKFKVWRGGVEQQVFFDGVALALQIRRVYHRASRLVGFDPQYQRRYANCWDCQTPFLVQLTGSDTVECSNCGSRKTYDDYQKYCEELSRKKSLREEIGEE